MKRSKVLTALLVTLTLQFSMNLVSFADTFTAQGTLSGTAVFRTRVFNTTDGSTNAGGVLGFNGGPGATYVNSSQAIEINYDDNSIGNQAIRVVTTNPGDQEGMVGVTDSTVSVPLLWVVTDDPVVRAPDNNYNFVGNTVREAFVVDDNNRAVNTYANVAFSISSRNSLLANFPSSSTTDTNGDGNVDDSDFRAVTDGQLWLYFGTNYTGAPAQAYSSANLVVELVTLP